MSKHSPKPKLSILIPSTPNRVAGKMLELFNCLEKQVNKLSNPNDVELLVLLDNKKRSIGFKRESLLYIARGDFVAFMDDDDMVHDFYIEEAVRAIDAHPEVDVITFKEYVYINDSPRYELTFELGYPKNDAVQIPDAKRPPWHCCFWKRTLAQKYHFPDLMYGEDWAWASQINQEAKTSHHIDKFMRTYKYNDTVTEAIE